MLKRALLLQLMLLVGYITIIAQPNPNSYEPVKSAGDIPSDMLIKSSKKYEVEKSNISKQSSKKDRKSIESFYLSTNFEIDKLLLSGMVSFNDPITNYLNRIVDVLLKDEPKLRQRVKVYTMKSTVMNAFATNQGIIFVNVGLLARIKSEAELAFVLAHEITHVEEKHSLNKYLKIQTIERDKSLYKGLSLDDKLANVNHYSRELETEADEKGLARYLKAGYSIDAIESSFTALSYSHMPFVDYTFDYTWLESPTFSFPKEFWREKVSVIKPLEDNEDSTSTHPSIQQRKDYILSKTEGVSAEGRSTNLVSIDDFNAAVEFSQFEVCRLHLARQRYDLAIYEAQALLKKYPNNLYLQKITLKALAAKAYIAFDGIYINEWEDFVNEELQGNSQRCYHFNLSLATNDEYIASVATRYAWQLKKENPKDDEIETIADSLMSLLFLKIEADPTFFSMTPRTQTETDSINLAYDKVYYPERFRKADSLSKIKLDSLDKVALDEDGGGVTPVRISALESPKRTDAAGDNDRSLTNNSEDVTAIEEPEDTFYVTTVAEAKKYKIKMTGYEKYMLKHKDKYDIKGVKRDGTLIYNETVFVAEGEGTRNREDNDRNKTTATRDVLGEDSTATADGITDSNEIEEELYMHDFKAPVDAEFHKYAFVDFADDPSFMKKAKSYHKLIDKDKSLDLSRTERKKRQRERVMEDNMGLALNINKVVIVNPVYNKINLKNPEKQQYLTSEKNQQRYSKILKTSANASGIKYQLIDNKSLKSKDTETFNDISFLNEWLSERLELGSKVPIASMDIAEREALVKKYGTRYFMWTGNVSVKEKSPINGILIMYSIVMPPILPFVLPKMISAGKYQIYYYLVYDLIDNKMVIADVITSNQLERNDFLNSQVYFTFNQLKHKR